MSLPSHRASRWLWAGGAAGLVLAGRWREIHLYGDAMPYLDQWRAEALDIIVPWLKGTLSPGDFLAFHHEHFPLWTRLFAWLQVALTGRWDPLVQTAVNAGFQAAFVGWLAGWLHRHLPVWSALACTLLLVVTSALPHSWENSTWAFQSQFPLALLFLVLHVTGSLEQAPGSARWWGAQVAGLAGLLTLGSMWTAPLCVVLAVAWTRTPFHRLWFVPAGLAAGGLGLMLWILNHAAHVGALAQTAGSMQSFLNVWLLQLSWPANCVLLNLPLFVLAWQLRGRREAAGFDRAVLALGLWSVTQALALAYARGGGYAGFVSRYGDLLAVGLFANGVAFVRLLPCFPAWRWAMAAGALVWTGLVVQGLHTMNTEGHTAYFQIHAAERAALRREAVLAFYRDNRVEHLADSSVRDILYSNPPELAAILSVSGFKELLPDLGRPALAGRVARQLLARWSWFVAISGAGLLGAIVLVWRNPAEEKLPPLSRQADPWRWPACAMVAIGSGALMLFWPHPFQLDSLAREFSLVRPPGTMPELSYEFVTPSEYPASRIVGASALSPGALRNYFRGTHISGPTDTCVVRSEPFALTAPWLVVPYTGYPAAPGNGIELVVEGTAGEILARLPCDFPGTTSVGFWEVNVQAYAGHQARFVLTDGRTDASGWVAVAPPQPEETAGIALRRQRDWNLEQTSGALRQLAMISGALGAWCLWTLLRNRLRPASASAA